MRSVRPAARHWERPFCFWNKTMFFFILPSTKSRKSNIYGWIFQCHDSRLFIWEGGVLNKIFSDPRHRKIIVYRAFWGHPFVKCEGFIYKILKYSLATFSLSLQELQKLQHLSQDLPVLVDAVRARSQQMPQRYSNLVGSAIRPMKNVGSHGISHAAMGYIYMHSMCTYVYPYMYV